MGDYVLLYLQVVCPVEQRLPWHTQCCPVQDLDGLPNASGARQPRTSYSHPESTEKVKQLCIFIMNI